jgi:hypothetical protein
MSCIRETSGGQRMDDQGYRVERYGSRTNRRPGSPDWHRTLNPVRIHLQMSFPPCVLSNTSVVLSTDLPRSLTHLPFLWVFRWLSIVFCPSISFLTTARSTICLSSKRVILFSGPAQVIRVALVCYSALDFAGELIKNMTRKVEESGSKMEIIRLSNSA